jgi:hypothetical protein
MPGVGLDPDERRPRGDVAILNLKLELRHSCGGLHSQVQSITYPRSIPYNNQIRVHIYCRARLRIFVRCRR